MRGGQLPIMTCTVPRLACPSRSERWQVYIPAINWLLMVLAILVVLAFRSTEAIGNAYGGRPCVHACIRVGRRVFACACDGLAYIVCVFVRFTSTI